MQPKTNEWMTWLKWIKAWQEAYMDDQRLGLLHSLTLMQKHASSKEEILCSRNLLLIADCQSGFSELVRNKALQVWAQNNLPRIEQGILRFNNPEILRPFLWLTRPNKTGIWLKNSQVIWNLRKHQDADRMFTICFGYLLREWDKDRKQVSPESCDVILKTMTAWSQQETARMLRAWLFPKWEVDNEQVSRLRNYSDLKRKLTILNADAMSVLRTNVVRRNNSLETAVLFGDELASFVFLIDSIRDKVDVELHRETLEYELKRIGVRG